MPRYFNTAGPNKPEQHYTLPALARLPEVRRLVDQGLYFVVHAPRQVGKTTALLELARELTAGGAYVGILISMKGAAPFPDDVGAAESGILDGWRTEAQAQLPPDLQPTPWPSAAPGARIGAALAAWARTAPRPLVIFLDDIQSVGPRPLISALAQIRAGYPDRPGGSPHSLALVGRQHVGEAQVAAGIAANLSVVPFNIVAEALTVRDLTRDEVSELYGQHTEETGQVFTAEAVDRAFAVTHGQPWRVNVLARHLTEVLVPDRAEAVLAEKVGRAAEVLADPYGSALAGETPALHRSGASTLLVSL